MNTQNRILPGSVRTPVVVHPGPASIDELLRYIDPASDRETESFVAAIYADRRDAAVVSPAK